MLTFADWVGKIASRCSNLVGHLQLLNTRVDLDSLGKGQNAVGTDVVGLEVEHLQGLVGLEGGGKGKGSIVVHLSVGEEQLLEVGVV